MDMLPRGIRNNNPGNIRPDPRWRWVGELPADVGASGGYCRFDTPEHGLRALIRDVRNKRRRGLDTILKIKTAFAPSADGNDVAAYAQTVCQKLTALLGVTVAPTGPLPPDDHAFRVAMAKATVRVECGDPAAFGRGAWWYDDATYLRAVALEEAP